MCLWPKNSRTPQSKKSSTASHTTASTNEEQEKESEVAEMDYVTSSLINANDIDVGSGDEEKEGVESEEKENEDEKCVSDDECGGDDEDLFNECDPNDPWVVLTEGSEYNDESEQKVIGETLVKVRKLIATIKTSTVLSEYINTLKEKDTFKALRNKSLISDCPTRWNSTSYMINSVLKHKLDLQEFAKTCYELNLPSNQRRKLYELEISENEYTILEILSSILTPFHLTTQLMSKQKDPSMGLCVFSLAKIESYLKNDISNDDAVNSLKFALYEKYKQYFATDGGQRM
ncbi:unnamed protein product [Didymodactylos carnosus]|uniref:Uncharacterized protein n=1 Tax=Didymodactylos carnosus TaxID=1234261 RepID=A0A816CE21_9BILA|nr:unnamed protein product [Didymodactylos carnosus]CAF4515468.1 unnamed protein product [Didymodactylos carnosus]